MSDISAAADKIGIQENLSRYMMAIDAADRAVLRAVFSEDGVMNLLEPLNRDQYCDFVCDIMKIIKTHHVLLNSVHELDGQKANSISNFWAYHRVPGECEDAACAAMFGTHAVDTDVFIGGYYEDVSIKTALGWKIQNRKVNLLWRQQVPSATPVPGTWFSLPPWFSGRAAATSMQPAVERVIS